MAYPVAVRLIHSLHRAASNILHVAFLVAWGGIAAQSARLLGLLKLSLDLKRLGVSRWETLVFWGWLLVALGKHDSYSHGSHPDHVRSGHVRFKRHQLRNTQV